MSNYKSKFTGEEVDERLSLAEQIPLKQDKEEGKGLSTNDFTDEDKSLVATIPNLATKNEVAQVRMTVQSKPDKEGYYPDMTVGKSDNLVGRGEATEEEFSFRPSAGDVSIEDGTARISTIKGNSVVWNQGNYKGVNGSSNGVSITKIENGILLLSGISNSSSIEISYTYRLISNHKYLHRTEIISMGEAEELSFGNLNESDARKKFLENGIFEKIVTRGNTFARSTIGFTNALGVDFTDVKCRYRIHDLTQMFGAGNEPATVEEFYARKPIGVDEFAYNEGEIINMNVDSVKSVGDNAYDYTKGYARVVGGHTYSFEGPISEGDVKFSTTIDGERIDVNVVGNEFYDFEENGYVWIDNVSKDICICLQHSYDKPTKPYEEDILDLSFILQIVDKDGNLLFPNGLRSAGSVYDEIRYDVTKKKWVVVKRIGVVENMGDLVWVRQDEGDGIVRFYSRILTFQPTNQGSNTKSNNLLCRKYVSVSINKTYLKKQGISMSKPDAFNPYGIIYIYDAGFVDKTAEEFATALQGVKLYYELAEPIVEEIEGSENWNLDYPIWDFGTEEAIASVPSAPFRADIIYQFNAVDRIRNNSDRIAELESQIASLMQTISTIQTTNVEE